MFVGTCAALSACQASSETISKQNQFSMLQCKVLYAPRSIFDQGQTDFSMKDPPRYMPIVNNKDISRLFVMDYEQSVMTVHAFDFVHKEKKYDFHCSEFKIRIRLFADWQAILHDLEMQAEYYGDWDLGAYDVTSSNRLIIIAKVEK
jgi:hypothetical protein